MVNNGRKWSLPENSQHSILQKQRQICTTFNGLKTLKRWQIRYIHAGEEAYEPGCWFIATGVIEGSAVQARIVWRRAVFFGMAAALTSMIPTVVCRTVLFSSPIFEVFLWNSRGTRPKWRNLLWTVPAKFFNEMKHWCPIIPEGQFRDLWTTKQDIRFYNIIQHRPAGSEIRSQTCLAISAAEKWWLFTQSFLCDILTTRSLLKFWSDVWS